MSVTLPVPIDVFVDIIRAAAESFPEATLEAEGGVVSIVILETVDEDDPRLLDTPGPGWRRDWTEPES